MKKIVVLIAILLGLFLTNCSDDIINYETNTHKITYKIYNESGSGHLKGYYTNPETNEYQIFYWNMKEALNITFETVPNIKLELFVENPYGKQFKVTAKIVEDDYNILSSKSDYGEVFIEYNLY